MDCSIQYLIERNEWKSEIFFRQKRFSVLLCRVIFSSFSSCTNKLSKLQYSVTVATENCFYIVHYTLYFIWKYTNKQELFRLQALRYFSSTRSKKWLIKKATKFSQNTWTFLKCFFPNSRSIHGFRSISVPIQGTEPKKISNDLIWKTAVDGRPNMKNSLDISSGVKAFDFGKKPMHLPVFHFCHQSEFWSNEKTWDFST